MPTAERLPLALAILILAACGGPALPPTTTNPPVTISPITTQPPPPASTTVTTPAPTTTLDDGILRLAPAQETMPATWRESLFIPYGDTPDTLGTYLGGDGEGIQVGPDYGAQAPDGSWWFLDTAKLRLAHFSEDGAFLDELVLDPELLADGIYFQYQLPRVLDSGMVVANRLAGEQTLMLRVRGEEADTVAIDRQVVPRTDDGNLIYGFEISDQAAPVEIDVNTGTAVDAEWFRTRAGDRYRVAAAPSELQVELPDAGVDLTLPVEAGEVGGGAFFSLEVASGTDGTLHLFLLGLAERDESLQLAGYMTVGPTGVLSSLEPVRDPFTVSDPGSPSRLGVQPGTDQPWMMFIDEDGVRIFRRS